MEKEIEKAIRETLVIRNPQSIHIAVKKILLLFSVSGSLQPAKCQCGQNTLPYKAQIEIDKCSRCGNDR